MRTSLGRAGVAALVVALLLGGPATAAENGWIEGSVQLGTDLVDGRSRFTLYSDPTRPVARRAKPAVSEEMANVVIYVESVPVGVVSAAPRPTTWVMEQKGLEFIPHVLPVVKGETVQFLNADPLFHNVFSLSKASSFDLGRYPSGQSRAVRFTEPGVVKVFCHIHSDMSAVVLVLDNPFFASPGKDGRYLLPALPAGTYRVVAWHGRARPIRRTITVEAGKGAVSDFEIPLTEGEDGG